MLSGLMSTMLNEVSLTPRFHKLIRRSSALMNVSQSLSFGVFYQGFVWDLVLVPQAAIGRRKSRQESLSKKREFSNAIHRFFEAKEKTEIRGSITC
jgi:hypothetical protein